LHRAFAFIHHIPPDAVLPEDLELLARAGSDDNPEYEVEIELRQAIQSLQRALKTPANEAEDDGKGQAR